MIDLRIKSKTIKNWNKTQNNYQFITFKYINICIEMKWNNDYTAHLTQFYLIKNYKDTQNHVKPCALNF